MPSNDPGLSEVVHQLLFGPVDSFEKLEVLVALHGASGAALTLGEIAARACLTPEQVEAATAGLTAAELIERTGPDAWRIRAEAAATIGELAVAWATSRPSVLRAMTERALGRIRASAARAFADAFRLRKQKKDGEDDDDS